MFECFSLFDVYDLKAQWNILWNILICTKAEEFLTRVPNKKS